MRPQQGLSAPRPWARMRPLHSLLLTSPGLLTILILAISPAPSAGQLPAPTAVFAGAGQNGVALARGLEAIALNPANLGLRDNPGFSISILGAAVEDGLHPIGVLDLWEYAGARVPAAAREAWLSRIEAAGTETGFGGVDISLLSLSWGPVGLQLSTVGATDAAMPPGGAEVLFFGNSGRTGSPRELSAENTRLDAYGYSTLGLSFGYQILPDGLGPFFEDTRVSLGATVKYTMGHGIVVARDAGSALTGTPPSVDVRVPSVQTRAGVSPNEPGSGIGLDLGAAWEGGPLTLSVAGRNVVNLFQWDPTALSYRPNRILLDEGGAASVLSEQPIEQAPRALIDLVESLEFAPELVAGAAYRTGIEGLTLAGDYRRRFGDGMGIAPAEHIGASFEFSPGVPVVKALRAGGAWITGGEQYGAGISIGFGSLSLAAAYLHRATPAFEGALASLSLSIGGR